MSDIGFRPRRRSEHHGRPIQVLLVDGDATGAKEIEDYFRRHGVSLETVSTLASARELLARSGSIFDVVILELMLTDGRGESLLADLEGPPRQPAVIIVSSHLSELRPETMEFRPAILSKPVSSAALLRMVKTLVGGYTGLVISRFANGLNLTKRESEALVLVARGLRAKEMANCMGCSEQTVYTHLTNICTKTGCGDYHEIVARLFSFACQALGHTPPDHAAIAETMREEEGPDTVLR